MACNRLGYSKLCPQIEKRRINKLVNVKTMPEMKFSIIIPLYNKQNYIRRTLESVLSQTYTDFEVIVVNDGSKDNSLQEARKVTDSRIRVIDKENGGVSSARNRGIKEAESIVNINLL